MRKTAWKPFGSVADNSSNQRDKSYSVTVTELLRTYLRTSELCCSTSLKIDFIDLYSTSSQAIVVRLPRHLRDGEDVSGKQNTSMLGNQATIVNQLLLKYNKKCPRSNNTRITKTRNPPN